MDVDSGALSGGRAVLAHLEERCPEFLRAAELTSDFLPLAEQCARRPVSSHVQEAFSSMLNQLLNDWLDLMQGAVNGMGRPAFRSARSIFEISLFAFDVFDDDAAAERYLAHDVICQLHLYESADHSALTGKQLKSARHRRRKELARLEPEAKQLLQRYGKSYGRSWTNDSVRMRADEAGRRSEYSYYRYASAVSHGSVSGRDGSYLSYASPTGDGTTPVFRLGANLYLCVQALAYGMTSLEAFLNELEIRGVDSSRGVALRLAALRAECDDFASAMLDLHHAIAPEEPPAGMNLVALLHPTGVDELFLHDVDRQRVVQARATNPVRVAGVLHRQRQTSTHEGVVQSVWLQREGAFPIPGADWENDDRIATPQPGFIPRSGAQVITPDGAFVIGDDLLPRRLTDDD